MTRLDLIKRAEWILAIGLSLLLICLLMVRATHAGALWRDEAAVVQLAQMPGIADIARTFQHEAFPPLFPIMVRVYTKLLGTSDAAMRVFGFCVGCCLISAFWISSRLLRSGVPLVALALLSLNTTFLVWGTTIRGYGLGSALVVLTFGCLGSLLPVASRKRIVIAAVVCVFGVQVLLYNAVLLVAIGGSAVAILLTQRRLKRAVIISAICALAGCSVLPYIPAYVAARDWNILVRGAPTPYSLWKHFEVALGNPGYSIPAVWYFVAIAVVGVFLFQIYKARDNIRSQRQLIWFALLVCGLSVIGCYSFLLLLSYTTNVWYYLAFTCVAAAALDLVASSICTSAWLRFARLVFAVAALAMAPFADWNAITERQTNVDLAANAVATRAAANDLVLVVPWQFGIPFQRYYTGAARWMTIPNIADHRVHRYDLFKAKMISAQPITDVHDAIRATLTGGNRIWLVGGLNLPLPGKGAMMLPPAPASRFKWDNRAYTAAWWQQVTVAIVEHAKNVDAVRLAGAGTSRINELEQTSLDVIEGWH